MKKVLGQFQNYIKAYGYVLKFTLKSGGVTYVMSALLGLLISFAPLISIFIWEQIVNSFLVPFSDNIWENKIVYYFIAFFLIMILKIFLNQIRSYISGIASSKISYGIETLEMKKMMNVSTEYLENPKNLDAVETAVRNGWFVAMGANSLTNTSAAF